MARHVAPRLSYDAEAAFLSRTQKAVELDENHSQKWKQALIYLLGEAVSLLLLRDGEISERLAEQILSKLKAEVKKVGRRKAS
jgi:hypothetical protein